MELNRLDKRVLKLWYIRAAFIGFLLLGGMGGVPAILLATGAPNNVTLAVSLGVGIPTVLLLGFTLVMPVLRYNMYAWGYDDMRITV